MSTTTASRLGPGFLSFNTQEYRIVITGSALHPPEKHLLTWQEEGFETKYIRFNAAEQADYIRTIKSLHKDLQLGGKYAIICYGDAASIVLKVAQKPLPRCCAIIAFYPSALPTPKYKFPTLLKVQIHVPGTQQSPHPDMCEWTLYRYEHCAVGFADPSARAYSAVEANLAWSRALGCIYRAFKKDVDIEPLVQAVWAAKYEEEDPDRASMAVVQSMTQNSPHLTLVPTLEGGVGRKKLAEFYREFFVPSLVEDFKIRLVSRTIGMDRVVDEMIISFTHSADMDWILPGVPPTGKHVEIAVVSVVAVRGGKLVSEHMYWDQASVLVQVGLLDPKVVPKKMRSEGLRKLPIAGPEATQQLVEPRQERYNSLLKEHGLMSHLDGINGIDVP